MSLVTHKDVKHYHEQGYHLYHTQLFSPEKMRSLQ
jgi:hypothetical protein